MRRQRKPSGEIKRRLCALFRQKAGVTIVELIVTFLLITLFTTGTCRLMADSMNIYNKIRVLNHVQQSMDTILDKVTGEIEGAQVNMRGKADSGEDVAGNIQPTLTITADQKSIKLYDRTSSEITISSGKDRENDGKDVVIITYAAVQGSSGDETYREVKWMFDRSVYVDFQVKKLKFSLAGEGYPKNVIKVELTLTSPRYGDYTNTRYVACYNFESDLDLSKIKQE